MMTYDWKKTGMKVAIVSGEIIVAGLLWWVTNNPTWIVVAPLLEGILDYLKHKDN